MSAREEVEKLLKEAISSGAHPERIAGLQDAYDAVVEWQKNTGRYTTNYVKIDVRRKRKNDQSMDTAARRWSHWTSKEIEFLETSNLSNEEIAKALGRTIKGVRRKRDALRSAASTSPS